MYACVLGGKGWIELAMVGIPFLFISLVTNINNLVYSEYGGLVVWFGLVCAVVLCFCQAQL